MKYLLVILFVGVYSAHSQTLFKGLEYGMTKSEAKSEFRKNKEDYNDIDVGNGFKYRLYHQNFEYWEEDKLTAITFSPKGGAMGISYDNAVGYLNYSKSFFEALGYTVFFEPNYWNAPLNFKSKYGLLMESQDKTKMVQLFPTVTKAYGSNIYNVVLKLYEYDVYMKTWNQEHEVNQDKIENSGF